MCEVRAFAGLRGTVLIQARLIKHTVEGIRTRLDRIYLDALNKSSSTKNSHDADSQEVNDLQEELESLYSEVFSVAQMSAEQQYLEPALEKISSNNGQGQERSVKAIQYVTNLSRCFQAYINN